MPSLELVSQIDVSDFKTYDVAWVVTGTPCDIGRDPTLVESITTPLLSLGPSIVVRDPSFSKELNLT